MLHLIDDKLTQINDTTAALQNMYFINKTCILNSLPQINSINL